MKCKEIYYNTVSKRAVLWARPYGGLWPLYLFRPDPPSPSPPPIPASSACSSSLAPSPLGSVSWFVGRLSLVVVVICCWVLYCFPALGEGASRDLWHKCEPLLCVDVDCHVRLCGGSDLYVILYCGFSLKDTSWASSANVLVWKLPVLLITMGMIRN